MQIRLGIEYDEVDATGRSQTISLRVQFVLPCLNTALKRSSAKALKPLITLSYVEQSMPDPKY